MMINEIKTRLRLHHLFNEKEKIAKNYHMDKNKISSPNEKGAALAEASFQNDLVQDEIDTLITRHLTRRASRLFVPVPDPSEALMWRPNEYSLGSVLTNHGIVELRRRIREETEASRTLFITILTSLTGIIGALTGLVAIFMKK